MPRRLLDTLALIAAVLVAMAVTLAAVQDVAGDPPLLRAMLERLS